MSGRDNTFARARLVTVFCGRTDRLTAWMGGTDMTSSITIRPSRRTAASAAGILLAASLSACGSSGTITAGGSGGSAGTSGGAATDAATTPSAAPTPEAMTSDAYKLELTGINTALAPDFTAVLNATTNETLKDALSKLSEDASAQQSMMAQNPPTAAAAADSQLASALKNLADSADSTSEDIGSKVCTAGAATAELTRSDGASAIRDAVTALAAVDPTYKDTVKFMPAPIEDQHRQLPNGKVLRKSSGPGTLEITASDVDAVITLTVHGSKSPTTSIYVRANSKASLHNIPGKTFDAYMSSGTDWDSAAGKFTHDCAYGKADDTFDFSSSDWSLELTKQVGGNLSMTDLGGDDAPKP